MRSPRLAALVAVVLLAPLALAQRQITTPVEFLGKEVGADYFLANYTQLTGYWKKVAAESDRMVLEEIGTTSYGQTMLMAVISSPENLAKRDEYREISARLCRARGLTDDRARALAASGRSVIWIDAGMHATECVAAQNIIELVYRMNAQTDAETRNILDNVILLVTPANPDGMEMIANGYMATKRVGSLPVLYQRYIGHDNNRDFYMATQPETEAINRQLYRRWYPQVIYNHHQSAPRGTIIFTPPFRDPFNYNIDPLVVRGIDLVSAHMNSRFAWEGKPGVISRTGASYSTWWNGGLRTTAYFHNMIGILTESFGRPAPTEVTLTLRRRLPYGDYPMPVETQEWHARQTIEYLQTANFAILDLAARYREEMLFNIYQMGRNAIARGNGDHWTATPRLIAEARRRDLDEANAGAETVGEGGPGASAVVEAFADPVLRDARAFILSADQADFAAATRFVGALLKCGVEVHRATGTFEVGGARYPAGSYVVFAGQAFRAHVMDMFEPQWHPDDIAGGEPVRPYDSAGWTPALSMGVEFDRILVGFEGPFEPIEDTTVMPGVVVAGRAGYLLDARDSASVIAVNRLLAAGESVARVAKRWRNGDRALAPGAFYVKAGDRTGAVVQRLAAELGADFHGVDEAPGETSPVKPVRIGLFDRYGGNMATGWTQWVLEQFEFPVELVFGQRIHDGSLRQNFDVLMFQTGIPFPRGDSGRVQRALRRGRPSQISKGDLEKLTAALPPFEDWSNAADRLVGLDAKKAVPALREFVESGGVVLAFGSQAEAVIKHLELPIEVGTYIEGENGEPRRTRRSEFFIPTSLVRARVDASDPLGYGTPEELAMVYRRSPVFTFEEDARGVDVLARYAEDDILMSGWAIGEEHLADKAAVVRVKMGKGLVGLYGPDVLFRGQPQASFKLVFNALLGRGGR